MREDKRKEKKEKCNYEQKNRRSYQTRFTRFQIQQQKQHHHLFACLFLSKTNIILKREK